MVSPTWAKQRARKSRLLVVGSENLKAGILSSITRNTHCLAKMPSQWWATVSLLVRPGGQVDAARTCQRPAGTALWFNPSLPHAREKKRVKSTHTLPTRPPPKRLNSPRGTGPAGWTLPAKLTKQAPLHLSNTEALYSFPHRSEC